MTILTIIFVGSAKRNFLRASLWNVFLLTSILAVFFLLLFVAVQTFFCYSYFYCCNFLLALWMFIMIRPIKILCNLVFGIYRHFAIKHGHYAACISCVTVRPSALRVLSVRLFVCLARAPNSKQKGIENKPKSVWTFPMTGVLVCQFVLEMSKVKFTGRQNLQKTTDTSHIACERNTGYSEVPLVCSGH